MLDPINKSLCCQILSVSLARIPVRVWGLVSFLCSPASSKVSFLCNLPSGNPISLIQCAFLRPYARFLFRACRSGFPNASAECRPEMHHATSKVLFQFAYVRNSQYQKSKTKKSLRAVYLAHSTTSNAHMTRMRVEGRIL